MRIKNKKLFLIFTIAALALISIVICIIVFFIFPSHNEVKKLSSNPVDALDKPMISFGDNITAEINSQMKVSDVVVSIRNAALISPDAEIDTSSLGNKSVNFSIKTNDNKTINYKTNVKIIDTISPVISYKADVSIYKGESFNPLNGVSAKDNSNEKINVTFSGKYDVNVTGKYTITYTAKDSSNNISSAVCNITVKQKPDVLKLPYFIEVNRKKNVVTVYGLDDNQNYTRLIKTFVCSVGTATSDYTTTPIGTYQTTNKYVWRKLDGSVYGQYATRITRDILFHSVPYFTQNKSDLEYLEYNKLGSAASLGCVRLTVTDAKWIYDNCVSGTSVKIYDSDTLKNGVVKPSAQKISPSSNNKGWDPTDPDINNPWKK